MRFAPNFFSHKTSTLLNKLCGVYIDALVQECSISIATTRVSKSFFWNEFFDALANTLEIMQSCTKPLILPCSIMAPNQDQDQCQNFLKFSTSFWMVKRVFHGCVPPGQACVALVSLVRLPWCRPNSSVSLWKSITRTEKYRQTSSIRCTKTFHFNVSRLILHYCLCQVHWSQVLSQEWRYSWSSVDRQCSYYIWVINNFIAYYGALY